MDRLNLGRRELLRVSVRDTILISECTLLLAVPAMVARRDRRMATTLLSGLRQGTSILV